MGATIAIRFPMLLKLIPTEMAKAMHATCVPTANLGTPTGTVQFKDNGGNLGSPITLNAGGVAQFTTTSLSTGTHTITADYSGDGNFLTSTGTLSGGQVVKPQPTLSINDVSIAEGHSGTSVLNFTVTLSAASSLTVTANYATTNGTATAPSDYTAIASTLLTFNPGDTIKTVAVTINGDISLEPDETFTVNLTNPTNATISKASGTGTIQNDDAAGGFFSFSPATDSVNEATGLVTVTVVRTNIVTQAATVDYATDDTGASANCGAQSGVTRDTFAPGLLPGLGGVAYQLLRLHPACDLPSVLTLTDGVGRPA